jgi:MFS family permease
MSKLLVLLGSISVLTPFSLDLYLPALPAIAADLLAGPGSVQLTLPVFFVGLAISQLFFGSVADHVGRLGVGALRRLCGQHGHEIIVESGRSTSDFANFVITKGEYR